MITQFHVQAPEDNASKMLLRRSIRFCFGVFGMVILLLAGIHDVSAQVPEDFGYNRLQATGRRPLLIILTHFSGYPDFRDNVAAYFNNLAFNTSAPAVNPSLASYYTEISNGRFTWEPAGAGVVGPYEFTPGQIGTDSGGKLSRITLALKAAADGGFNFGQFDQNGDQTITSNELGILIIDNLPYNGGTARAGATRASDPVCFKPDNSVTNLCLRAVAAGQFASFMTLAHELLHDLGLSAASDIYGSNDNSQGFTIMGATIYDGDDDRRTFHLDPYHKMQLGWVEPKLRSIFVPGTETIGAAQLPSSDDQPVLLYSSYDFHEFFILEYRTTAAAIGAGYDANLASDGLVIWQAKLDDNKEPAQISSLVSTQNADRAVFTLGAPNLARGHGAAWTVGDLFLTKYEIIPYALSWLNGNSTGVKIKVGSTSAQGSKLTVSWGDFTDAPPAPKSKIVYYSQLSNGGAVGQFDENGNHRTYTTFFTGSWTTVVSDAGGIFYYNKGNGTAMLASVDAMGNHTVLRYFPQGYFGAGWTHIVSHRGYLFFYSSTNGMAAIGTISANGFRQYKYYPVYSFGTGWTHIVSTQNGLLFYSKDNGAGAVGDWDYVYTSCSGCFATVSEVRFKQLNGFGAGSFTTGWTSIVETGNGVLFYRKSDGMHVMTDMNSSGGITTRSGSLQYLKPGYTAVVAAGDDILLYDTATGNAALAAILKFSPWAVQSRVGTLFIRNEFTGSFVAGWTHLVATADPAAIH